MKSIKNEVILYVIVGVLGTLIDLGVFFLLNFWSVPILFAQWISAILGATHNHIWHHFKVFDHNQNFGKSYSMALLLSVLSIFISGPFLLLLQSILQNVWVSKVLVVLSIGIANYLLRRWVVFRKDKRKNIVKPAVG